MKKGLIVVSIVLVLSLVCNVYGLVAINGLKADKAALTTDAESATAANATLTADVDAANAANTALTEENAKLKEEVAAFCDAMTAATPQIADLTAQLDAANAKIAELTATNEVAEAVADDTVVSREGVNPDLLAVLDACDQLLDEMVALIPTITEENAADIQQQVDDINAQLQAELEKLNTIDQTTLTETDQAYAMQWVNNLYTRLGALGM